VAHDAGLKHDHTLNGPRFDPLQKAEPASIRRREKIAEAQGLAETKSYV